MKKLWLLISSVVLLVMVVVLFRSLGETDEALDGPEESAEEQATEAASPTEPRPTAAVAPGAEDPKPPPGASPGPARAAHGSRAAPSVALPAGVTHVPSLEPLPKEIFERSSKLFKKPQSALHQRFNLTNELTVLRVKEGMLIQRLKIMSRKVAELRSAGNINEVMALEKEIKKVEGDVDHATNRGAEIQRELAAMNPRTAAGPARKPAAKKPAVKKLPRTSPDEAPAKEKPHPEPVHARD